MRPDLAPNHVARIKELNKTTFSVDTLAIIEIDLKEQINTPDSSSVEIVSHSPNHTHFKVYTDKQALFVISEIYYPPGWKILVDGQETKDIYKTNHAIQSIIVPAGEHTIEVNFAPDSYANNVQYAMGSLGFIYLVIFGSLIKNFLAARKEDIQE